jgi:hypothetical protein
MTITELQAYKRKAKAQRDNWKAKALTAEKEVERLNAYLLKVDKWYNELCTLLGIKDGTLFNIVFR